MIKKKRTYNRKPKERPRRDLMIALMNKNNISQMELAEQSKLSYKSINWIINHPDRTVRLTTAVSISQVLGVSVETLF